MDKYDPQFRAILDGLLSLASTTDAPPSMPPLQPPPADGTLGDMDPWQQSVEARLTSLDARLGRMEPGVAEIKIDVAVLKATVATKQDLTTLGSALTTKMQIYLGIVGSLVIIGTAVTKFL